MKELDLKKVAEAFDTIAEAASHLANSFRSAGGSAGGAAVNGKAGRKPAAKPADDPTEDDVREALKGLVEAKGKTVMVQALESVGAAKLADVDESQYQELIDKVQELLEADDAGEPETKTKKPAAKGKTKGPTLADVTAAAQALIDADKPTYLKLAKKLGKPSEMDEGDYAAAIDAYVAAMPEDDDDIPL